MINISGNYNTTEKEIEVVKGILKSNNIDFLECEKCSNRDDADIIVTLRNGKTFTIEVKEESITRFEKWGDLGIDYISSCVFKKDTDSEKWKGSPKNPDKHDQFLTELNDKSPNFKWGKIIYSRATFWLFFVMKGENLYYYEFFDGASIVSPDFLKYLRLNCQFTLNNKPSWQMSRYDTHHSATFFINNKNAELNKFKVDIKKLIENS